ncbi:MAG: hypothetical protein AAFQ07_14730 [Chloroflexota bacterium]
MKRKQRSYKYLAFLSYHEADSTGAAGIPVTVDFTVVASDRLGNSE